MSSATITAQQMLDEIDYYQDDSEKGVYSGMRVINDAGSQMFSAYRWDFLKVRAARLRARASITFSGATWTEATKTLSLVSATPEPLASYQFESGDTVRIDTSDPTGVVEDSYEIVSTNNTTNLVLKTSISDSATDEASVSGKIDLDFLTLPDDFFGLVAEEPVRSVTSSLTPTTLQHLLALRTNPVQVSESYFYGAITRRRVGDRYRPIMEIWPGFTGNEAGKFTIFYRQGWTRLLNGNDAIVLPSHGPFEMLFAQYARAIARLYEEGEDSNRRWNDRLREIEKGRVWRACVLADRASQPRSGAMHGGAVQSRRSRGYANWLATEVAGPS